MPQVNPSMVKVSLPNGCVVEGETPQEVAEMLTLMGVPMPSGDVEARAHIRATKLHVRAMAEKVVISHWNPDAVREFIATLPDQTRKFLLQLIVGGETTAIEAAQRLQLHDPKPIGSMLASIRRHAEQMRLPTPVLSEAGDDGSVRRLKLDLTFRDAATRHLRGEP